MRVAVIGSRTFTNYEQLRRELDALNISCIISGGAMGADTLAIKYAKEKNIPFTEFLPNYSAFGKGAPIVRNRSIVNASHQIIAFWDGKSRGTAYSIDYARKTGKQVKVISI